MVDENPMCLCFADMETTGLDPHKDLILELAIVMTSFEYPYLERARAHYLIKHPRDVQGMMDDYVLDMHTRSGLLAELAKVEREPPPLTTTEIEWKLLELSQDWPPPANEEPEVREAKRTLDAGLFTSLEEATELCEAYSAARAAATDRRVVIAGNSVGFDLGFLRVHMPTFAGRLSHRVFDVSAWSMGVRSMGMPRLEKKEAHRAMKDVESAITQAREIVKWSLGMEPLVKAGLRE